MEASASQPAPECPQRFQPAEGLESLRWFNRLARSGRQGTVSLFAQGVVVLGKQPLLVQQRLEPLLELTFEDLGQVLHDVLEVAELTAGNLEFLLCRLELQLSRLHLQLTSLQFEPCSLELLLHGSQFLLNGMQLLFEVQMRRGVQRGPGLGGQIFLEA